MTSLCYKCFTPLTLKYKTQKNKKKHATSTGITHPLGVMPVGYSAKYFIWIKYSVRQFFY